MRALLWTAAKLKLTLRWTFFSSQPHGRHYRVSWKWISFWTSLLLLSAGAVRGWGEEVGHRWGTLHRHSVPPECSSAATEWVAAAGAALGIEDTMNAVVPLSRCHRRRGVGCWRRNRGKTSPCDRGYVYRCDTVSATWRLPHTTTLGPPESVSSFSHLWRPLAAASAKRLQTRSVESILAMEVPYPTQNKNNI